MEQERKFLRELYLNRIDKFPYIEYFQKDSYLRNALYDLIKVQHDFDRHSLGETRPLKLLREISVEIEDFENLPLLPDLKVTSEIAQNFAANIINKLESIGIPKLKKKFLKDFTANQENKNVIAKFVVDNLLHLTSEISVEQANKNYRELKRIVDVFITEHLKVHHQKELAILAKFKDIGYLDFNIVEDHLLLYDSISKKLNYLRTIKERYYDRYESIKSSLESDEYYFYVGNSTTFWESVFGNHALHTPLRIQTPVFYKNFPDGLQNPEFTYWFLKYNAEELFRYTIESDSFKDKMASNLKATYINAELKELEKKEERALDLLLNKELDINAHHINNYKFSNEVELLRILDGNYYKKNTTQSISSWGTSEVQAYFSHILYKSYLNKMLTNPHIINKPEDKQPTDSLTIFERISRELNVVAWAYECQFMEATTDMSFPMLHSKGRFLFNCYHVTSNIEMLKLQEYIKHYTERFETTNNTTLVLNEIKWIYEKVKKLIDYYYRKLTDSGEAFKHFMENMPNDFESQLQYKHEHMAVIVTDNLNPTDIIFGLDINSREAQWAVKRYQYLTSSQDLLLFCQKLLDFTAKFEVGNSNTITSRENSTYQNTKPTFRPEIVEQVFDLLKDHFSISNQTELKSILQSGSDVPDKLHFQGNGNRLADAFKQLFNADFITGCQKLDLQNWIYKNFSYKNGNNIADYKLRYLEDIISTNKDCCKKPIFEVRKNNGNYTIVKV